MPRTLHTHGTIERQSVRASPDTLTLSITLQECGAILNVTWHNCASRDMRQCCHWLLISRGSLARCVTHTPSFAATGNVFQQIFSMVTLYTEKENSRTPIRHQASVTVAVLLELRPMRQWFWKWRSFSDFFISKQQLNKFKFDKLLLPHRQDEYASVCNLRTFEFNSKI